MPANKKIKIESDDETGADRPAPPDSDDISDDTKKQAPDVSTEVTAEDKIAALEEHLEAATRESEENMDKFMRASADLENYKKRTAREMDDLRKYANQSLVKDLLPVLDNLELAIKSSRERENGDKKLLDGVELIRKEILKVFEKFNIEKIDALGKAFDPRFHEAVMREETDDYPENSVISEFQKGYLIHDRLLRPAMVVVAVPKTTTPKDKKT